MVRVYGRSGCGKCTSLKEKLELLGVSFESRDVDVFMDGHEGWRTDGSVDLMTHICTIETKDMVDGHIPIPIVEMDGEFYAYSQAIKELKAKGHKASTGAEKMELMAAVA